MAKSTGRFVCGSIVGKIVSYREVYSMHPDASSVFSPEMSVSDREHPPFRLLLKDAEEPGEHGGDGGNTEQGDLSNAFFDYR